LETPTCSLDFNFLRVGRRSRQSECSRDGLVACFLNIKAKSSKLKRCRYTTQTVRKTHAFGVRCLRCCAARLVLCHDVIIPSHQGFRNSFVGSNPKLTPCILPYPANREQVDGARPSGQAPPISATGNLLLLYFNRNELPATQILNC